MIQARQQCEKAQTAAEDICRKVEQEVPATTHDVKCELNNAQVEELQLETAEAEQREAREAARPQAGEEVTDEVLEHIEKAYMEIATLRNQLRTLGSTQSGLLAFAP